MAFVASGYGLIPMSQEHKNFVASRFKCQNCGKRLFAGAGLRTYSKNGEQLSYWRIRPIFDVFLECEHCDHRWPVLRGSVITETPGSLPLAIQDIRIAETSREEESIGEDQKIIDNSKSSITLTRRFEVTKEWAQTCVLEFNEIKAKTNQIGLGPVEALSLQTQAQTIISKQYSVEQDKKLVYTEDLTLNIPPNTKLRIVFQWKRIWQHGLISLVLSNGRIVAAPFRVAVAVTFDQVQRDEV